MLVGYARVSTDDQTVEAQVRHLKAAGCEVIHRETGSGGNRERPVLAALLAALKPRDVLVVYKLDRVARSLSHLLEVMETLDRRGVRFRSLTDPVDTSSPQGKFALQILGAVAEFERALIRERTLSGLAAAREKGRIGGNPTLKAMTDEKRMQLRAQQRELYLAELQACEAEWLRPVRSLRPAHSWRGIASLINAKLAPGRPGWTGERLRRAATCYAGLGRIEAHLLDRAPSASRAVKSREALRVVAGLRRADPRMSLRRIAAELEALGLTAPNGGASWSPATVRRLLERAQQLRMVEAPRLPHPKSGQDHP